MLRSTDRFLTTHTGSLPRPDDLVQMMFAKEEGVPVDREALDARVREAVTEMVERQSRAGVDIVNDGEMSKPSYATYVKDRLSGFGGTGNSFVFQDLVDFPRTAERVFANPGRKVRRTPACNGPIEVMDEVSAKVDVANLNASAQGAGVAGLFSSAASPGVISLFFRNEYYKTHEEYLFAIAEAMRFEYETIAEAGLTLQLDCPDLAMGRHVQYADLSLEAFRGRMRLHIEALNHAVRNIPAERLRLHMCWGNYPGPHHCDVPFADIIDVLSLAKPAAILFEAANPRHAHEWEMFETMRPPEGKVLVPGVIECQSNYIEHPELVAQRIGRYARLVGRENVMAGVDCGFSIHVGQGGVDPDVVWAKLAALAEGARIASDRFW
ncbi:cobalamin-independent methionine synthase II family protein [Phenylobacterium sp.]|uniref:cobalamin-independent methionine synthase II family protein n=1 Tax=Phenylobacterium sp. TaxID=1871053 RepID=UPI0035AF73F8